MGQLHEIDNILPSLLLLLFLDNVLSPLFSFLTLVLSRVSLEFTCQNNDLDIYIDIQVADVPQKRKKGMFGTKGGDKEVGV